MTEKKDFEKKIEEGCNFLKGLSLDEQDLKSIYSKLRVQDIKINNEFNSGKINDALEDLKDMTTSDLEPFKKIIKNHPEIRDKINELVIHKLFKTK